MFRKIIESVRITPAGSLDVLSQDEVAKLRDTSEGGLYDLFRQCSLAVLNSGSHVDNAKQVMEEFSDFSIRVIQQDRGIKLELHNAPAEAFVDGEMIRGIREHLFAVLRDTVYVSNEIRNNPKYDLEGSSGVTNAIFHILRNAGILVPQTNPNMVVCWGGHSISRQEYDYTKDIGYELGLRGLNVCTGCGPGAMKGPMKGATIGHAKQRTYSGRYLGITEPGIIAAESPNPIVNELVIMPDIEKRLEAFVRVGHGIVVFPGGAGTAEEILYLLGILLHPGNNEVPFPLIFTGPADTGDYFTRIHEFIGATLGFEAQQRYKIIIDDAPLVARELRRGIEEVRGYRREYSDAYYFNWLLSVDEAFQRPFVPNHENMASLALHRDQDKHALAADLRRAFSGIVAGNVKVEGIRAIEAHGPFEMRGDRDVMQPLDDLLDGFVAQSRMKLPGTRYEPCYKLVT
ncbi:MAG: nucleotide 5'-monophosphate nucleosidase PpnN [Pseudomonadota bacterium]|nr:nucleotide 5'-monophosphate nucleosidase PpnN [Pseudomonadota bacterium]